MLDALRRLCERLSVCLCLSVLPPILRGKLRRRRHGDGQNRDVGKAGYAKCKASLSPLGCFSYASARVKDGETQGGVSGLARRNGITCSCSFLAGIWPDTRFLPSCHSYLLLRRLLAAAQNNEVRDRSNGTWPRESTCVLSAAPQMHGGKGRAKIPCNARLGATHTALDVYPKRDQGCACYWLEPRRQLRNRRGERAVQIR